MTLIKQERTHYLDWLRVFGTITVFYFHCAHIFDPIDYHVKNAEKSMILFTFVTFCMFWLMPLFFMVAGAASRLAFEVKTVKEYAGERFKRLVIPFLMGVIVLIPPQDYVEVLGKNIFSGSFLEYLPKHLSNFRLTAFTPDYFGGIGHHVWFIAFLFIFSMITIPLFRLLLTDAGKRLTPKLASICEKTGMLYLLAFPLAVIYLFIKPLAPEYCGWADFLYWLAIFSYGFIFNSERQFMEVIQKNRWLSLVVGMISFGIIIILLALGFGVNWYLNPDYSPGSLGFHLLWTINTWSWLIFFMGTAQQYLNFKNRFLTYANQATMPFYLLHQTVLLLIAFYVVKLPINVFLKFLTISTVSLIVIMALYELVVKRFNWLRFLFGMKPKNKFTDKFIYRAGIIFYNLN